MGTLPSSCHTQWPSTKPRRIFAPTNGQQGGTWQVFRAFSASCSGQVQASESTIEIMNVFFSLPENAFQMLFHGDCFHIQMLFSQTLSGLCLNSTFKCISLKNSSAYALTQTCFFHFQKRIQMHFLKNCRVYASTFTSRNAFQMLFSW